MLNQPLLPTDAERSKEPKPGAPLLRVAANITNCAFGTGFFLLPKQLVQNGVASGVAAMLVLVVILAFSLHILNVALTRAPRDIVAYPRLVAHFTAPWLAQVVSILVTVYLLGACSAYLSLVADQLAALGISVPRPLALLLPLVVAAPFSRLRDIGDFALTSAFGICANSFVVLVLCFEAASQLLSDGVADLTPSHAEVPGPLSASTLSRFTLCSTVVFSFHCVRQSHLERGTFAHRAPRAASRLTERSVRGARSTRTPSCRRSARSARPPSPAATSRSPPRALEHTRSYECMFKNECSYVYD